MAKKEEAKKEAVAKVERNLQSIDYRKSHNQPIATPAGVIIGVFKTQDDRRGISVTDVQTGKILTLAGIGKTGKFYALTEVQAIQWAKEATAKIAVAI